MTLNERIKRLADAKGISLPALEAELGFGNSTIVKWKKSVPNADKLNTVAKYFNVTMDYLLNGNDEETLVKEDSVELVKRICKERKIPISRLEKDCGFSNGYIRKLQEGKFPSDRILVIAKYLNLPVSYLMTGENPESMPQSTAHEELGQSENTFTLQEATSMYGIFEELCKKNNVTPYRVCKETGITTATISNWKAGRYIPKSDKMQKIADYFGVTLDYLTTGKEQPIQESISLTPKDERDIKHDLDSIMNKLTNAEDGPAAYDGQDLSPEAAELFRDELEIALKRLKLINKEKYNPHKNKK